MGKTREIGDVVSNNLVSSDIDNDRVGIGSTQPNTKLDVNGIVTATSYFGSGIGLTATVDAPDATYGSESALLQITVTDGRITDVATHTLTTGASDIAEIVVLDNDVSVGTAGTINFGSNLSVTPASAGIVTVSFSGTIDNSQLAGGISNDKLVNDSVTYGGVKLSLGSTDNTPAFDLSDATNYPYSSLTGVSTDIVGDTTPQLGGNLDLNDKDITGNGNVNLTGVVTATTFSGSGASLTNIPNSSLDNSSVSYGGVQLSLGGSDATPAFDLSDATNYPYSSLTGITTDIVGDTSPQLGGNLDVNSNDITGTGNVNLSGIITASSANFSGNVSIGGTLTYEDVTNIDSVGLITARTGIRVLAGGINAVGVITATSFDGSLATTDLTGNITNAQLQGSIENSKLSNSTISYGGVQLSLGDSDETPAFDLSDATNYPYNSLTGVSTDIVGDTTPQLGGNLSVNGFDITGNGNVNLTGVVTATSFDGSLATTNLSGTITNAQLQGSIENSKLSNSNVSYGGIQLSLGGSDSTPAFDLSDATNYPYSSLTGVSTDIVGDTTPQLGGNLDVNGFDITGTGDINLTGVITATSFSGSGTNLSDIVTSITAGDNISIDSSTGNVTITGLANTANINSDIIDTGSLKVTGITTLAGNTNITGNITSNIVLINSNVGSDPGPDIKLRRNSPTPADNDYIGRIRFTGEKSDSVEVPYAQLTGKILDVTSGTQDGRLELKLQKAGFEVNTVNFDSDNVRLVNGTGLIADGTVTATSFEVDGSPASLVITSNTTFYVTTSGNDSTGDGSVGSPWATPGKAADFLSQRRIKRGVLVTVSIGLGTYTSTSNFNLGHPQGSQINYVGATPTGTKPRGTKLNGNSGGSAIRGNTSASESSNNDDLQDYYNTVFQFNNSNGFVIGGNYTVVLKNILIRGNAGNLGNGQGADGIRIQGGGTGGLGGSVDLINCAIHNFSGRGLALVFAGNATLNDLTITNCKSGVSNTSGIILGDQSSLGGTPKLTISNCTGGGFAGSKNASSRIERCMISNNGGIGLVAQELSSIRASDSTIDNNGLNGVFSQLGSTVVIRSTTVSNNGFDGPNGAKRLALRATDNSYIDFRSSTLTGNRSQTSPALNTLGNAGAYISA